MVPPPPSKGDVDAGVLRLSWGDALGQFKSTGWELVDAQLNEADPSKMVTSVGNGALVNTGAGASPFATRGQFGDAHLHLEFMLPKDGAAALHLPDVGAIQLVDNKEACGTAAGNAPSQAVYTGAGAWHEMDVFYRIATADSPAFLDRLVINGVAIQEGLEVSGEAGGRAAISVHPTTQIGLRNIQVKPLDRPKDDGGWTFVDPGENWDDWDLTGDCSFELGQDELVGKGALGHLWAPIDDLGNVTVRCRAKINANGAGALVVRAREGDEGVTGYAVRLNASFEDGVLTGSLRAGEATMPVKSQLIAADTWVDVEIDVTTEDEAGTVAIVTLNGVEVNRMAVPAGEAEKAMRTGGIAFRCDHDGTVLKVQNLRYRAK